MTRLEAVELTVGYARARVLGPATINIQPGVTVLLGANGVGKTTLLSTLAGSLRPLAGRILIDGEPVSPHALQCRTGFAAQHTEVASWLTVAEYLAYSGFATGRTWDEAVRRVEEVAAAVQLAGLLGQRTDRLSGGQRRQLALGACLTGRASVVLLDEPTAGLDPVQRAAIVSLIAGLRGCPVLVSTHSVPDVLDLADRVLLATHSGDVQTFDSTTHFVEAVTGRDRGAGTTVESVSQALLAALAGADGPPPAQDHER